MTSQRDDTPRSESLPANTTWQASERNPYAAPQTESNQAVSELESEAEQIRRAYLNHEANMRSVGTLYYLPALYFLIMGLSQLAALFSRRGGFRVVTTMTLVGLGGLLLVFAVQIRRLRRWATIGAGLFAVLALILALITWWFNRVSSLGIVFGSLIIAYVSWLMLGPKGVYVSSPEYQAIIAATPHVRHKSSWIVLAALLMLLALLGFAGLAGLWFSFSAPP